MLVGGSITSVYEELIGDDIYVSVRHLLDETHSSTHHIKMNSKISVLQCRQHISRVLTIPIEKLVLHEVFIL